ncbi:MAG: flagellar motor switch protein FliG [Phyllobacterium sp.]
MNSIQGLSGPEKVAALLVAMGRPAASRLLKQFNTDDLRSLAAHARRLDPIPPTDFEELVKEFEDAFAEGAPLSEAGMRFEGLLREALTTDEVNAVMEPRSPELIEQESVWDQLPRVAPDVLHAYLADQHPQIIAYVISKLPSDMAARVLITFPGFQRSQIVERALHIKQVNPAISGLIEDALRRDVTGRDSVGSEKGYHDEMANIINQLDKPEIEEMLASLNNLNNDDLSRIKARLFTFEDVVRISQRARMVLFDEIPTDQVTDALRGADTRLQDLVLSALSTRGRRMVEAELSANQDNISANAIAEARRAIARAAIALAARGEINLTMEESSN